MIAMSANRIAAAGTVLLLAATATVRPTQAHEGHDHAAPGKAPATAPPAREAAAPPRSAAQVTRLPDGAVFVPKPAQRILGIRTVISAATTVPLTAELAGHDVADPNARGRIQAPQSGRLEPGTAGLPAIGERVTRGTTVGWVVPVPAALDRGNQQASLAELDGQIVTAERRATRLSQLDGVVPRKDIESAQADLATLRTRRTAIAGSLLARLPLIAPVTGIVSQAQAIAGQMVDTRDVLFEIVDPARLMIEALAYDQRLATGVRRAVAVGPDGKSVPAAYVGFGRQLREHALPVTFRLERPDSGFAVGQPVRVILELAEVVQGAVLPSASLIRAADGTTVAWIHDEAERFVPARVRARALDGERVVITDGIPAGSRVVTTGAPFLAQVR